MNLWVRSQDKMKMLPNPKLAIIISGDVENGYLFDIYDTSAYNQEVNLRYGYLGTYDTEERALEVLDEIQNILTPKIDTQVFEIETKEMINNSHLGIIIPQKINDFSITQFNTYVYEMPKE